MTKSKNTQPFTIQVARNEEMNTFDLMVIIGGFKSKQDATDAADYFAHIISDDPSKWRVQ